MITQRIPATRPNVKGNSKKRCQPTHHDEAADLARFIQTTDDAEAMAYAASLLRGMNGTTGSAPSDNPVIPFGKHKGTAIKNCPQAYLRWLVGLPSLSPDLRGPIIALLASYNALRRPSGKGGRK